MSRRGTPNQLAYRGRGRGRGNWRGRGGILGAAASAASSAASALGLRRGRGRGSISNLIREAEDSAARARQVAAEAQQWADQATALLAKAEAEEEKTMEEAKAAMKFLADVFAAAEPGSNSPIAGAHTVPEILAKQKEIMDYLDLEPKPGSDETIDSKIHELVQEVDAELEEQKNQIEQLKNPTPTTTTTTTTTTTEEPARKKRKGRGTALDGLLKVYREWQEDGWAPKRDFGRRRRRSRKSRRSRRRRSRRYR